MVKIFSVYHFTGQMVDTIDDMSALTLTNHNKLLVAQADYTVEVKDLLTDKKSPLFVFPTVDKVQDITHCAAGNYVATVEGKQAFRKSDVLIVRVYTNWEPNIKECSKANKRLIRPRIAGVVSPSTTISDEDYLDMIEIPITFMSPTMITCCQKNGKLLIACGPTIHLFDQIYKRTTTNNQQFMDFISLTEVFDLVFQPNSVVIQEDVIAANSSDMISVFNLEKVTGNLPLTENISEQYVPDLDSRLRELNVKTVNDALNLNTIFQLVDQNREVEFIGLLDPCSLPMKVFLKGFSESSSTIGQKRFPFGIVNRRVNCEFKHGKVEDNFIVTVSDQNPLVVGRSLLALKMNDGVDELVSNIALQIFPKRISKKQNTSKADPKSYGKVYFFFTTFQEGYLFSASSKNSKESLQCMHVFNFSAKVISALFQACFLHVLTEAGLETYNLPTLRSIVFNKNYRISETTHVTPVLGMHPFMGIVDFLRSNDLITIFSSASEERKRKLSLPWTVYSLKMPSIYDVYKDMIIIAEEYKAQHDLESYKYLMFEAFLILQTTLQLQLPLNTAEEISSIRNNHIINAMKLAHSFFKSDDVNDILTGSAIILTSGVDPLEFIKALKYKETQVMTGICFLIKNWVNQNNVSLNEGNLIMIIEILGENGSVEELALLLLSNSNICRSSGHKATQYLKDHFTSNQENSNVYVLFALCILYTQVCQQAEVIKILTIIQKRDDRKILFVDTLSHYWTFLFEKDLNGDESITTFSELASILIEHLPSELSRILSELILKKKKFSLTMMIQMFLKLLPFNLSIEKGNFVLRNLLESVFASSNCQSQEPNAVNYLMILIRSYLAQLSVKDDDLNDSSYQPIFVINLPEYVEYLPKVENVSYLTLRRIQELVWSGMINEKMVKEILEALPSKELKLNVLAMSKAFDIKELITQDCGEAILPFAKFSFHDTKNWRDLLNLIQNHFSDLKNSQQDATFFEAIFLDILDHLAVTMSPAQLCSILESTISSEDQLYRKYVMKAQQVSYANEVETLIINTSQQLLQSHSLY